MRRLFISVILAACFLSPGKTLGQEARDSVSDVNRRANKAAWMSAVLPGLGQAYNKSYWKIPVLYAGAATLVYFISANQKEYQSYKDAYLYRLDGDPATVDDQYPNLTDADINVRMNYYRRNRDLSIILTGALYVLNIIDAYVDAHLKEFDIGDDLSLRTRPWMSPSPAGPCTAGISLSFSIH
jgi:hypothetical protein